MNTDKVYVNAIRVDEKIFPDGGSLLKLTIKADELIEFLQKNKNAAGKVNLTISKKKNPPAENQSSHYTVLDTWQPRGESAAPAKPATRPAAAKTFTKPPQNNGDDASPF
jgi:hypothetical protein